MGKRYFCAFLLSPSARREWIEIAFTADDIPEESGLPLRGGSGLKSRLPCYLTAVYRVSLCEEGVD